MVYTDVIDLKLIPLTPRQELDSDGDSESTQNELGLLA